MVSKLASFPVSLPTTPIPEDIDATKAASSLAQELGHFNENSFVKDAVWRDTFALTGTQRTFYGASAIATAWHETSSCAKTTNFTLNQQEARVTRLPNGSSWIDVPFTFETEGQPRAECFGVLSIVPSEDGNDWKIWTLRTILEQLEGFGDVDKLQPKPSILPNGVNGHADDKSFDVVVVGGGHAGLSMGGRLQALGLKYVILDKNKHVGDSWKTRYGSVKLHTSREYSHLPFDRTFPAPLPEWLTKDQLAEGYQNWVNKFDINIWLETRLLSGRWDESNKQWSLIIERGGEAETIKASHLVMAIGSGCQIPITPNFANEEAFTGIKMHSVDYKDSTEWKGKHGLIIGTANTAHDVAEDMLREGLASVTMVQRSRTYVLPVEYYLRIQERIYNEETPTELADKLTSTGPLAVSRLMMDVSLNTQAAAEPERFDALERAGFKVERYGDIIYTIFERMGRHYIDVGCSAKIADGRIKVKSDALAVRYTESGLEFDDGSVLPADVIILATGFRGNLRDDVRELLGDEVADRITDFWGLDDEGEPKGAYRPTGREYYHPEEAWNSKANLSRSQSLAAWNHTWSNEILLAIHRAPDQGRVARSTAAVIR